MSTTEQPTEGRNGHPRLHTITLYAALGLGLTAMTGLALVAVIHEHAPDLRAATGPILYAILTAVMAAGTLWIVSINVRPQPSTQELRNALTVRIDALQRELAQLDELPALPEQRKPSPYRRRLVGAGDER